MHEDGETVHMHAERIHMLFDWINKDLNEKEKDIRVMYKLLSLVANSNDETEKDRKNRKEVIDQ